MIFLFKDGSTKELPVGAKTTGMMRNGLRPISVSFTYKDLEDLQTYPHIDGYLGRLQGALLCPT